MFIFPMAGMSRRFFDAGYDKPKYQLDVLGETLFYRSVQGFRRYFNQEPMLFICRDVYDTPAFINEQCNKLGLHRFETVTLNEATCGQAETVKAGLERASNMTPEASLTIFNIDTIQRDFCFPWELSSTCPIPQNAHYIEVFEAEGSHWSFAALIPADAEKKEGRVAFATEKRRVSNLCSTGLYHFKKTSDFTHAYINMLQSGWGGYAEHFVCPMYNDLIDEGKHVYFSSVASDNMFLAGTPTELGALLNNTSFAQHVNNL